MFVKSANPLITKEEIQSRVKAMALEISRSYSFDIILSALTGGFIFTADLCRYLRNPNHQVFFVKASSYGAKTSSSGILKISGIETLNLKGKRILLVDEILDSGITLSTLVKKLKEQEVADLRTCVLLNKKDRRQIEFTPDFVGFPIENEFVVGYGLDFNENYRTLPDIWTLKEV